MSESEQRAAPGEEADCWPTFPLRYTFNPEGIDRDDGFAPDELVVFDPARTDGVDGAWLSARRESYVGIEDVR